VVIDNKSCQDRFVGKGCQRFDYEGIKFTVYIKLNRNRPLKTGGGRREDCCKKQNATWSSESAVAASMDVAKAIAILATNKGNAVDYLGLNKSQRGFPKSCTDKRPGPAVK